MQKRKPKKDAQKKAIEQVYRLNLDTMLLLIAYLPFQRDVAQRRADFGIPEQGTEQAQELWYRQLHEKTDREARSQEFRQKLHELYMAFETQQISYSEYREKLHALNDSLPLNRWRLAVKSLTKKYRLPSHFEQHIQEYILTNVGTAPAQNYVLTDKLSFQGANDKQGQHEISVKIHYKPTMTEWQEIRRWITGHTHTPKPINKTRSRPRTQIERNLRIMHESSLKGADELVLSDGDIAARIWEDDASPEADHKQRQIIIQTRRRIQQIQKELFGDG